MKSGFGPRQSCRPWCPCHRRSFSTWAAYLDRLRLEGEWVRFFCLFFFRAQRTNDSRENEEKCEWKKRLRLRAIFLSFFFARSGRKAPEKTKKRNEPWKTTLPFGRSSHCRDTGGLGEKNGTTGHRNNVVFFFLSSSFQNDPAMKKLDFSKETLRK